MKKLFLPALVAMLLSSQAVISDNVSAATNQNVVVKSEKQKMDSIRYLQKQIEKLKKEINVLKSELKKLDKASQEYRDNLKKQNDLLKKSIYYGDEIIKLGS